MRISDWSSDVCSSDLPVGILGIYLDHLHLIAGEQQQLRILHRHDDIGLVEIIDADLENSRHAVTDFAWDRAERRRAPLRVDDRDVRPDLRAQITREFAAEGDIARTRRQAVQTALDHLARQRLVGTDVGNRPAAHEHAFYPPTYGCGQRLPDTRGRLRYS